MQMVPSDPFTWTISCIWWLWRLLHLHIRQPILKVSQSIGWPGCGHNSRKLGMCVLWHGCQWLRKYLYIVHSFYLLVFACLFINAQQSKSNSALWRWSKLEQRWLETDVRWTTRISRDRRRACGETISESWTIWAVGQIISIEIVKRHCLKIQFHFQ